MLIFLCVLLPIPLVCGYFILASNWSILSYGGKVTFFILSFILICAVIGHILQSDAWLKIRIKYNF
jgi:hypothetical protein